MHFYEKMGRILKLFFMHKTLAFAEKTLSTQSPQEIMAYSTLREFLKRVNLEGMAIQLSSTTLLQKTTKKFKIPLTFSKLQYFKTAQKQKFSNLQLTIEVEGLGE
jgi:hypothetical protein